MPRTGAPDRLSVSLCILCHDRPDELAEALGSAGDQPWHEVLVLDMASHPPILPLPGVKWLRSEDNVGVTAGRNRLAREAGGDILVFIDDDAVIRFLDLDRLRYAFHADCSLGAVAFRIVRPGEVEASREFPFRGSAGGRVEPTKCTYFVGCGYAVRRQAHVAAGGYDDRYFYSTEEVDLGFRLIREQWSLRYDPLQVVEHRPSARGRTNNAKVVGWQMRNRLLLVRSHLPVVVAVPHALIWGVKTGLAAIRSHSLGAWWQLAREGITLPVERRPLSLGSLVEVHRAGGRVLY